MRLPLRQFSLRTLLLVVACLGILSALYGAHRVKQRALEERYTQFFLARSTSDVQTAYELMSPGYREAHTLSDFAKEPGFDDLEATGYPSAHWFGGRASVYAYHPPAFGLYSGPVHYWHFIDGDWYFTGQADYFLD